MRAPRAVCAGLSALYFAACVGVVLFTTGFVRGSAGDLLVVALLTHILGIVFAVDVRLRAGACLALALVLEFGQMFGAVDADSPMWMHLILGSTPDPIDGMMYVLSAGLGVLVEWGLRVKPPTPVTR